MSHKVTIGVSVGQGKQKRNRREINIPSVVAGKRVGMRKAIEAFFGTGKEGTLNRALGRKKSPNLKNVTRSFASPEAATKAAKKESKAFGRKKKRK